MVNRVLRDDPSKSDMHNREGLSIRMIWEALKDWRLWPIYTLGLTHLGKRNFCDISQKLGLTVVTFVSPRRATSDLSHSFATQSWLYNYTDQSP